MDISKIDLGEKGQGLEGYGFNLFLFYPWDKLSNKKSPVLFLERN